MVLQHRLLSETCLTSQDGASRKYINRQEKMLLRPALDYFYPVMNSRKCLGKMNFVKLKEPRVEWFASKNDMSLKQHCLQLQLKQYSVVTVMIVILKYGSKGQRLRVDLSSIIIILSFPRERQQIRIYSQNFSLPTAQNIICLEMYRHCGFQLL